MALVCRNCGRGPGACECALTARLDMEVHEQAHRQAIEAVRLAELEQLRADRHHDVLCLVLKAQIEVEARQDTGTDNAEACVHIARAFADLAYPPPKAEP